MNAKRTAICGTVIAACIACSLFAPAPRPIDWESVLAAKPLLPTLGADEYHAQLDKAHQAADKAAANAADIQREVARIEAQQAAELAAQQAAAQQQAANCASVQASGNAGSFQSQGVIGYNGLRVTYYNPDAMGTSASQLGNTTMGSPITYNSDGIGTYNGIVAVAMPSDYAYGTVVDTPFGQGIVIDHSGGAMDVVADW